MKTDLKPLDDLLTSEISPQELAGLIDEFISDYLRISSQLQDLLQATGDSFSPNEKMCSFLYNLCELKDTLIKCSS